MLINERSDIGQSRARQAPLVGMTELTGGVMREEELAGHGRDQIFDGTFGGRIERFCLATQESSHAVEHWFGFKVAIERFDRYVADRSWDEATRPIRFDKKSE